MTAKDQPRRNPQAVVRLDEHEIDELRRIDERIGQERSEVVDGLRHRLERPHPMRVLLEHGFGRIVAHIVHFWGKRDLDQYLSGLTISDRPTRQGFPPAVMHALMELLEFHREHVLPQAVPLLNPFCGGPAHSSGWGEDSRLAREVSRLERVRAGLSPEEALANEHRLAEAFIADTASIKEMGAMVTKARGDAIAPPAPPRNARAAAKAPPASEAPLLSPSGVPQSGDAARIEPGDSAHGTAHGGSDAAAD